MTESCLDSIMSNVDSISYTEARENLGSIMDRVCNEHSPVIITRSGDQSVVMISLEDYQASEPLI